MARWEYKLVSGDPVSKPALVLELNRLGREGWEVVGFTDHHAGARATLLKRPLAET